MSFPKSNVLQNDKLEKVLSVLIQGVVGFTFIHSHCVPALIIIPKHDYYIPSKSLYK